MLYNVTLKAKTYIEAKRALFVGGSIEGKNSIIVKYNSPSFTTRLVKRDFLESYDWVVESDVATITDANDRSVLLNSINTRIITSRV